MKRRQFVFVFVVFGFLLTGFVLERQRQDNPFNAISITAPGPIELPPVELPPSQESFPGRVVDESGNGVAGVGVHLFRRERSVASSDPPEDPNETTAQASAGRVSAEPLPWARTDAEGRFLIEGATPGKYGVALLAPGRPVGNEDITLPLALPVGSTLTWRIGEPVDAPEPLPELLVRGLTGRLSPPVGATPGQYVLGGHEIWFEPVGSPMVWLAGQTPRRTAVELDGSFALADLTLGRYDVRVLPPWATGGSWPQLEHLSYVHLAADASKPNKPLAEIGLRLRCGTVNGTLYDREGFAIEGALVQIRSIENPEQLWPSASSKVNGDFEFRGLPAGRYRVRVHAGNAEYEEDVEVHVGGRSLVQPPGLMLQGQR